MLLALSTSAAHASNMTDCWLGKKTDDQLGVYDCQHTSRINANGHRVQDVSMRGPKSDLNYSLVIWRDPDTDEMSLDFIMKGESKRVDAWYDDDNDLRWDVGKYAFALRYSDAARSTSNSSGRSSSTRQSPRLDLNRPMSTGLRQSSTRSEYGL